MNYTLTAAEIESIKLGETLDKDYFYIPIITVRESGNYGDEIYSLRFSKINPPWSIIQYASKVTTGKTLWEALRIDLEKDFDYPGNESFLIEEVWSYDNVENEEGKELSRLLILAEVFYKFDTHSIKPAGLSPFWVFEDYDGPVHPINKYLTGE